MSVVVSYDEGTEIDSFDSGALAANIADYFAASTSAGEGITVKKKENLISPLLKDLLDPFKPSDIGFEERDHVKAILQRNFQYEFGKCPSSAGLQKNPWFANSEGEV